MTENQSMPLPKPPTRQPQQPASRQLEKKAAKAGKASQELLFKAILLGLIGLGVLLSPYFITSPGMQGIVAQASVVGWFALVLGVAFLGLYLKQRLAASASE